MENDRLGMLKQLLQQQPNDAFARYGLAMEYSKRGENDAALDEFSKLLQTNPDYVPAYHMAGQLLVKLSRNEAAREMLHKGIAAAVRSGNAHAQAEMQAMLDESAAAD